MILDCCVAEISSTYLGFLKIVILAVGQIESEIFKEKK
jgi:hypothetical protein